MDNLEGNCWNLVLIRSDMNGIFRSVWIVWFDTYQGRSVKDGSKDFGLGSLVLLILFFRAPSPTSLSMIFIIIMYHLELTPESHDKISPRLKIKEGFP
jgi:hypothetical protein